MAKQHLKNMTSIKMIGLLLMLFAATGLSYAQNINVLEKKYSSLRQSQVAEQRKLDSLNNVYQYRASVINAEKKKQNPDKEKILQLMSSSATISNHIDNSQSKLHQLDKQVEKVKYELNKEYTEILDSLKTIKNPGNETISSIYSYTEKKLIVSPKVNALSFDPEKILSLEPSSTGNRTEREVSIEYIQNALNEVEQKLSITNKQYSEVEQMINLENKAARFVEEAEFDRDIRPSGKVKLSSSQIAMDYYNGPRVEKNFSQVSAYIDILNQLRTISSISTKSKFYNKPSVNENINIRDFRNLLKEVKKELQDYKVILSEKIRNVK